MSSLVSKYAIRKGRLSDMPFEAFSARITRLSMMRHATPYPGIQAGFGARASSARSAT